MIDWPAPPILVPIVLAACPLVAGCSTDIPPSHSESPASAEARDSTAGEREVMVDVKSWAEVRQMVADHHGKVVIVDIWSTWCGPCLREFPNLVRLHRRYAGDVACISVDIDYIGLPDEPPESFREKVLEFLKKQGATFENVISSDPDEEVMKTLGISSIPAVLIYGREGELREKFTNDDATYGDEGFTYSGNIIPLVEKLIAD